VDFDNLSPTKAKRLKLIIDKSYKMFIGRGISATSMNDIADECNITRRTIYNYFESKTDLLYYLMNSITEAIDPDFHLIYDENLNASANMRNLLKRNFDSYYYHMTDFLFITQVRIFLSYRLKTPVSDVETNSLHIAFISEIEDVIKKGQDNKEFKHFDSQPIDIAKLIYRTLNGYLSNITIGVKVDKNVYDNECNEFENMIIEYLSL
jgi:AcrR family transcriptional regulator